MKVFFIALVASYASVTSFASVTRTPRTSSISRTSSIIFTGDILLDRGVRQVIERKGIDCLFTKQVDSLFRSANMVVGNLECPATSI